MKPARPPNENLQGHAQEGTVEEWGVGHAMRPVPSPPPFLGAEEMKRPPFLPRLRLPLDLPSRFEPLLSEALPFLCVLRPPAEELPGPAIVSG